MPINPWILAALVFGAIGLFTEVSDKKTESKPPEEKKRIARAPSTVNVNVDTGGKSKGEKKPKETPTIEKPTDG